MVVASNCHEPLGLQSGTIEPENINATSVQESSSLDSIRLNSGPNTNGFVGWSPDPADTTPYVTFDLKQIKQVSGVILQGGGHDGDEFVTTFAVAFSLDESNFLNVTAPSGQIMVRIVCICNYLLFL